MIENKVEEELNIADQINSMSEDELKELRKALFKERISIENEKKNQEEFLRKFNEERASFREEMKELNLKILNERKRLKEEESFFDKKMMILQSGFARLELDRKEFEREKKSFKAFAIDGKRDYSVNDLFAGINTLAGLKKRYRDLAKIFHPDNLDGDSNMILAIKEEYEELMLKY